jgi:DNA-binding response OmpR family regulator
MRILVAEDDSALASFVKKGLDAEHYAVDVSNDGEQARTMAGEFDYDLVVLDLNLPRLDGVAILRYLRTRKPSMPILVLTGRTRVEDRVQCLDLGADDYLGKPFSFSELSARIRALLRRCHLPAESVLTVDDLKLDRVERKVERAGRRIDLTGKEFALLEYLMRNAGRRITRAMIIEHVWNLSFDTCTNVVDVYVNYKAIHVGDLITIVVAQGTKASNTASVATARAMNASSGISALAGQLKTKGVENLFSPHSTSTLSGKSQGSSTSALNDTLAGRVVAVLASGVMVVEAERQLTMNNERQTILVRGLVRPGDVAPNGTVQSNQVANLELELKGKGVLSDGVRPPNALIRGLLWLVGF